MGFLGDVDWDKLNKKELAQAAARIGPTREDAVRWVLRFHEDNIENLSTGDCLNRQYECLVFARRHDDPAYKPPRYSGTEGAPLPTVEELPAFHSAIVKVISAIQNKQHVGFNLSVAVYLNPYLYLAGESSEWHMTSFSRNKLDVFQFALLYAIRPFAHLIHRCPECNKLFLAERVNQEYDTVQCQSRVASRRYRETHGLVKSPKPKRR